MEIDIYCNGLKLYLACIWNLDAAFARSSLWWICRLLSICLQRPWFTLLSGLKRDIPIIISNWINLISHMSSKSNISLDKSWTLWTENWKLFQRKPHNYFMSKLFKWIDYWLMFTWYENGPSSYSKLLEKKLDEILLSFLTTSVTNTYHTLLKKFHTSIMINFINLLLFRYIFNYPNLTCVSF